MMGAYIYRMKIKYITLIGSAIIPLMSGCISNPMALSAVGPDPASQAGSGPNGRLQVFSATETRADENTPDGYHGYFHPHSGYDIKDQSGNGVKYVANHASIMDEAPDQVSLPEGNYTIVAQSACCGLVTVPVRIQQGKTTVVHLDGNWFPPSKSSPNELVHLPDGESVGWSSLTMISSN
jgi:hypothetical protein